MDWCNVGKCSVDPSDHRTLSQFASVHLRPREAGGVSRCCWHMAFTLHSRVLLHLQMLRRTVFTDNSFLKCSWAHVVISFSHWCRVLMQGRPRDQRSWAFSVGFRPCCLCAEISPDSLNLLMILCTIYDEIPKFLAIVHWETLFLNCSTKFSHTVVHKAVYLAPSLLMNDWAFQGFSFYTQS